HVTLITFSLHLGRWPYAQSLVSWRRWRTQTDLAIVTFLLGPRPPRNAAVGLPGLRYLTHTAHGRLRAPNGHVQLTRLPTSLRDHIPPSSTQLNTGLSESAGFKATATTP